MILPQYLSKPYPTPQALRNRHLGADILIIGTGTSTAQLIPYRDQIRARFGCVIGLNFATKHFEDVLDYRLIVEKKADSFLADLHSRPYRKDLPHIINWKSIDQYPKDLPLYKTTRCNFDFQPNLREYHLDGQEGLLIGPQDSIGLSAGTVTAQALHLACIMGASSVYLVGADLMFREGGDHYYGGNYYANSKTKPANRSPLVTVEHQGQQVRTTEFFYKSAQFIDRVIETHCKTAGVAVYDASAGLITKAQDITLERLMLDQY
jgi:hypothetical protein